IRLKSYGLGWGLGTEQSWRWNRPLLSRPGGGHHCGSCHGAFSERGSATGAEEFVQFTGREDQQEFFADRLRGAAFGTVQFAGSKSSELLRHAVKLSPGAGEYQTTLWPESGRR